MTRSAGTPQWAEESLGAARGPVVVGYDGSEQSNIALAFAAHEAAARSIGLRIVSAYSIAVSDFGMGAGVMAEAEVIDSIRFLFERQAAEAAARCSEQQPGLVVTWQVLPGPAAGLLIEESKKASLVVVGSSGAGGVLGLLGGTSRQVATHCPTPTIVVRESAPAGKAIVVGVDGSPDSVRALAFAFDVASRAGAVLRAIHTWDVPPIGALTGIPSPEPPELLKDLEDTETRAIGEALSGFGERYPDVVVEQKVRRGSPVKVLVSESQSAALLVVGSRGRGGFLGLLLGSVSHGVLHHANCNVAVVTAKG